MSSKPKVTFQPPPHYHGGHSSAGEKVLTVEAPHKKHGQGEYANSASLSESAEKAVPRTQERGIGSSFAMAVDHILNNAKSVKDQGFEFTNPNVQTQEPQQLGKQFGKSFQPVGFDHKKKLNE